MQRLVFSKVNPANVEPRIFLMQLTAQLQSLKKDISLSLIDLQWRLAIIGYREFQKISMIILAASSTDYVKSGSGIIFNLSLCWCKTMLRWPVALLGLNHNDGANKGNLVQLVKNRRAFLSEGAFAAVNFCNDKCLKFLRFK